MPVNCRVGIRGKNTILLGNTPAATAAGQADGGGVPVITSRGSALEINADTGNTDLNGDYYVSAIKGNWVHGTADSNSSEIAILGSWNNNTAAIGSGDKYAVRGHLDFWGSTSLTGANVNVGAVSAYVENEATTTVDSGNVLCGLQAYQVTGKPTVGSGVFPARGINPALWIRASTGGAAAWQTGVYMPVDSVQTAIRIGNWVGSGASGSAIPFATTQNVYADGQLDLVAVFGESTSNLTASYSAKCGRFRHIATGTSLTVAHETYGLVGQMCAKGTTMTHVHGGVMGTFEGSGASVVCNSSYTLGGHGAVVARVGGHTNITATTPLAGFLAFNNGTANLASGTLSAFATSVRDTTYKWGYGIYMPSGSITRALYAAPTPTGASHIRAVDIAVAEATTQSSGYNASFVYEVTNTAAMTPTEYSAGRFNLMLDTGTKTGVYYAFKGKVGTNAAPTLTGAQVNGIGVSMDEIGTVSYYRCLWLEMYNTSNTTNSSFVCMKSQGSSQQLTALEHMGTNLPTNFLTTQTQTGGFRDSTATAGDQCIGHLKLLFGAQAAYINIYSDNS